MALTEPERVQVRLYMGWSARFFQFDSELEQAMNALDSKPDTEQLVRDLIAECQRIDAAITTAENRFKAAAVGSIKLTLGNELALLRSRGRQFTGRLSATLGVEVRHDVWSGTAPGHRATRWGAMGGGNYQRQG